jgi:hypothetical protein
MLGDSLLPLKTNEAEQAGGLNALPRRGWPRRPPARTGSLPPHLLDHGDQGHGSDQEADDGHSSSVPCDIWKLFFPNLAYCLGNCLSTTNTM